MVLFKGQHCINGLLFFLFAILRTRRDFEQIIKREQVATEMPQKEVKRKKNRF